MDTRKRNRTEVAANANAGFKKSKPETDSLASGIGSKMKPCTKFFSMAGCPFGESCHFLHFYPGGYKAVAEMMKLEPLPASRNVAAVATTPNGSASTVLKSKLCSKYNTAEGCKFGDKCHFAHGEWELNKPPMGAQPQDDLHTRMGAEPLFGRASIGGLFARTEQPQDDLHTRMGVEPLFGRASIGGLFARRESAVSGPAASFGASATTKISVAASLAGPIIGKSGANSKHISQKTGVKLGVREHESDPNLRNIELEGTLDQIQQASAMVKELIASLGSAGVGGGGPARSNGETTPPTRTMPPIASKYKTKLCENFAKGSCTFGDRCHFAHGTSQLLR